MINAHGSSRAGSGSKPDPGRTCAFSGITATHMEDAPTPVSEDGKVPGSAAWWRAPTNTEMCLRPWDGAHRCPCVTSGDFLAGTWANRGRLHFHAGQTQRGADGSPVPVLTEVLERDLGRSTFRGRCSFERAFHMSRQTHREATSGPSDPISRLEVDSGGFPGSGTPDRRR